MRSEAKTKPLILSVYYGNPDLHPPIINSSWLLAKAGYRVNIVCRDDGLKLEINYPPEIEVSRMFLRSSVSWLDYLKFLGAAFRSGNSRPDIIIGHDMHGLVIAKLLSMFHQRPVVYHCHDFFDKNSINNWGGMLVSNFEQHYARTVDLVIIPDAERAKGIAQQLQLPKAPAIVANGPMANHIIGNAEEYQLLRLELSKLDKHYDKIVFRPGVVGRGHAIEATILSIPYWESRKWGFVVMGRCQPEYAEQLETLAKSARVADQFAVLPPVSYEKIASVISEADVGHGLYDPIDNSTLYNTTASNKIMDYMAAGIPMIVSDRPAMRGFVEKYRCGMVAREEDPANIAEAVNALLGAPAQLHALGQSGRQAFEREFCYERQFAPVLEQLNKMLKTADYVSL